MSTYTHVSHLPVSPRATTAFTGVTGLPASAVAPIIKLDRELALKLKELKWAKQRTLKTRKVSDYCQEILSGEWNGISTIKIAVLPDGTAKKYDGQHRIEAVLMATDPTQVGTDPDAFISVTFTVHDVVSDRSISDDHFATTDHALSVRSKSDIDQAAGLPQAFKQTSTIITSLYAAILAVERQLIMLPATDPRHRNPQMKRQALEGAREFIDFYYPMALRMKEDGTKEKAFSKVTRNSAFLSLMYFLWCYAEDREVFKAFFKRLCTNSAPDKKTYPGGDPVNKLVSLLTNDNVLHYGTNLPKWTYPVAEAWNAYVKGRSLRSTLKLTTRVRDGDYTQRKFLKTPAKRSIEDWRTK